MCLAKRKVLVHFKMLFHAQAITDGLHAYVVERHIVAQCHGADLVEDAFSECGAGNGVNDDIGSGKHAMHSAVASRTRSSDR